MLASATSLIGIDSYFATLSDFTSDFYAVALNLPLIKPQEGQAQGRAPTALTTNH